MMTTKELKEYLVPDIDLINSSYLDNILMERNSDPTEEVLANRNMLFDNSENPIDDNLSNTDKGGLWDE